MKKIVIDLEFTSIPKGVIPEGFRRNEIIQIGAVKLNESDIIEDSFDMLVKPEFTQISEKIEKLTKISQADVEDKVGFKEAMDAFFNWIGEDDTIIYSWSMSDYEQLAGEARLKEYENDKLDNLLAGWMDLQKMVGDRLGIIKSLKLSDVVSGSEFEFEGQQHSALADSVNTAKILQLMNDEVAFNNRFKPILEMFKPKEEGYNVFASLFEKFNIVACPA